MFQSKKLMFVALVVGVAAAIPTAVPAQEVSVSATAINGGQAIAEGRLDGCGRIECNAAADGGTATACQAGWGLHGGCVDGMSVASTNGGCSASNGSIQADGECARAYQRLISSSCGGTSIAEGTSCAGPWGTSHAVATALSQCRTARANVHTEALFGGLANADAVNINGGN
jgi:hypothetical protein